MGSGKTTLAKKLANKLEKPFFDLDAEIEKETQKKISEIFNEKGEEYFRQVEKETLTNLISDKNEFVLSLGGGTPCYHNNIDLINQHGISMYLKYNVGMLVSRLINAKSERPLINHFNELELTEFVENKLTERETFYEKSKLTIEGKNIQLKDLLDLFQ